MKFVHKEPPEIPGLNTALGEKSGRARKPNKGTKVMSRRFDYLKGGKGTTERSRAIRHNSGLSYSVSATSIDSGSFTPAIASVPAGGVAANTSSRNTATLIVPRTTPTKEGKGSLSQAAKSSLFVQDSDADEEETDSPSDSGKSPFADSSESLSAQSSESDDDDDDGNLTDEEEDDEPLRRNRRSRSGPVVQGKRRRRN